MSASGREGGAGPGGLGEAAREKQVGAKQGRETRGETNRRGAGLFPAGLLSAFNMCLYEARPAREVQWLHCAVWEPSFLFFL